MTTIRILAAAFVAFQLVMDHAIPYFHGKRLFGVLVPQPIRYGAEGEAIIRRFELHLLPWSAACLAAVVLLPISRIYLWVAAAMIVSILATLRCFAQANAEARPYEVAEIALRQASLSDAGGDCRSVARRFLPPLAIPAAASIYLYMHWQQIPLRYAIHWSTDGVPNGWATKSFASLYGPPLFGGLLIVFLAGLCLAILLGSRRSSPTSAALSLAAAAAYFIAFFTSLSAIFAVHFIPAAVMLPLILGIVAAYLIVLGRIIFRMIKASPEPGCGDFSAAQYWRGGMFYSNPEDPAIFVQTPVGGSYSLNFGNRASWFLLALIVLYMTGMAVLAHALWR